MRLTPLRCMLLAAAALVVQDREVRAQDQPASGAPDVAPCTCDAQWESDLVLSMDVSRDGAWIATRGSTGVRLYPAAGGEPVTIELPKDVRSPREPTFSADSRWLVLCEDSPGATVAGVSNDKTQTIVAVATTPPLKVKKYTVKLRERELSKEVRKALQRQGTSMKLLEGEIRRVVPLAGPKAFMERSELDPQLWDVSSGAKSGLPPGLKDCDRTPAISRDGTLCAYSTGRTFEVREVASGRLVRQIEVGGAEDPTYRDSLQLAPDGSAVVCIAMVKQGASVRDASEYVVECWSTADGKLAWSKPLGTTRLADVWAPADGRVLATTSDRAWVFELADGAEVELPVDPATISEARQSADGRCLWVVTRSPGGLRHLHLPPRTEAGAVK